MLPTSSARRCSSHGADTSRSRPTASRPGCGFMASVAACSPPTGDPVDDGTHSLTGCAKVSRKSPCGRTSSLTSRVSAMQSRPLPPRIGSSSGLSTGTASRSPKRPSFFASSPPRHAAVSLGRASLYGANLRNLRTPPSPGARPATSRHRRFPVPEAGSSAPVLSSATTEAPYFTIRRN